MTTADIALRESSLIPVELKSKEGLTLINGTAASTGVAALAMYDANCLAATSQVLTIMIVKALCEVRENFDPIFAKLKPHLGQEEAARNIFRFLANYKLATESSDRDKNTLRQDRYSIQTASQ